MFSESREETVTRLLGELEAGRRDAFGHLFPLVYEELRSVAHLQRRAVGGAETLNTTALVHEVYLKLAAQERHSWRSRAHFQAVAARAMRHILVDYARSQRARKRGGADRRAPLEAVQEVLAGSDGGGEARLEAVLLVDGALRRLEEVAEREGRIVECRFFGGMTIEDTAEALGISPATVKRGWKMAQAWLYRDLQHAG